MKQGHSKDSTEMKQVVEKDLWLSRTRQNAL